MNEYVITRVDGTPDWSAIPSLAMEYVYKTGTSPVQAWAQIAYDDEQLFVRLWAKEENIRVEEFGPLANTWEDSCLEFFFSPIEGDPRYINLETTFGGAFYLGVGENRHKLLRLLPEGEQIPFVTKPALIDGGWEVSYSLSYQLLRLVFPTFAPKSGDVLRANCYKCGNLTKIPHWLSWAPLDYPPLDFHKPEFFGKMIFG